jgi:hypothetical protein
MFGPERKRDGRECLSNAIPDFTPGDALVFEAKSYVAPHEMSHAGIGRILKQETGLSRRLSGTLG